MKKTDLTTEKKPWDGFTSQTATTAEKKSPLDGLTPEQQGVAIAHAQSVLRNSSESVIDDFATHMEQAWALAQALNDKLTPRDPKNIDGNHPVTEWRLAQLLEDHLANTSQIISARIFLLGEK